MFDLINKIFYNYNHKGNQLSSFKELQKNIAIKNLFRVIENYSENSEIRYVGGCVRKILNHEKVEDIDLAVNLTPLEVINVLKKNDIKFYETGIEHGTITVNINQNKFEVTSLRKDILTDGRHAKVKFTTDWHEDALRRDFSINSIYADINGDLFDPFDGKKDLENGEIKFIGDSEKRIKEDYLRVLRYVRFFLNYSKKNHDIKVIKIIKQNLEGISKISSERLLDEFKKIVKSGNLIKLVKDRYCVEIISLIFPQFKNINIFKNLNKFARENINNVDFIFLISLMVVNDTDNTDYFIYKFSLSKKDKKRLLFLKNFFSSKRNGKIFSKKNLKKILYFNEKQSLIDLLQFQIFRSKKIDKRLIEMMDFFKDKESPILPIRATDLMEKYNILEGKDLGIKLKKIEEKWIENDFEISEKEVQKIINN